MLDTIEILELPAVPNVKFVQDKNGNGWYCAGDVSADSNLASVCTSADTIIYDRGFGG